MSGLPGRGEIHDKPAQAPTPLAASAVEENSRQGRCEVKTHLINRFFVAMSAVAVLLLASTPVRAGGDFVRVTQTGGLAGISKTVSIVEVSEGAVLTEEARDPRAQAPQVTQRNLTSAAFQTKVTELMGLGITNLPSVTQQGIEDAPTYHFQGSLNGQQIDFTVVGILKDLQDDRYRRLNDAILAPSQ